VATHQSIVGVLKALKEVLEKRISGLLQRNITVAILGTAKLATPPAGTHLGILLHRLAIDPFARNRYLPPVPAHTAPLPELPVNLHILLVGLGDDYEAEIGELAAAMQVIGSAMILDGAHLSSTDPTWGEHDSIQMTPEQVSTEDLMRMWDSFAGDFRLSTPYLIKTLRLAPDRLPEDPKLVRTLALSAGTWP
jgi:hypothetical protein